MITNYSNTKPKIIDPLHSKQTPNRSSPADRQMSLDDLKSAVDKPVVRPKVSWRNRAIDYWKQIGLRRKATFFAVTIAVVPVAAVGGIAHQFAARSLSEQIVAEQESRTFDVAQKVTLFTNHVVSDANSIASSPLLADTELSEVVATEKKVAMLNDFIKEHPQEEYESIAVFDLNGNLLFQSQSPRPLDTEENYSSHDYFQRAISSQGAAVNDPEIHSQSGQNSLAVATPIKDSETDELLGIVRVQMSLDRWKQIFQYIMAENWEYRLIDTEKYVFDAAETQFIGRPAEEDLVKLGRLRENMEAKQQSKQFDDGAIATGKTKDQDDDFMALASLTRISGIEGISSPGWEIALSRPIKDAFAPLRQLRLALLVGTSVTALIVAAIAAEAADRLTLPILAAAGAVKKIGHGELDTRIQLQGKDELAVLGANINKMADKLKTFVRYQAEEAKRSQQLRDLTLDLSRTDNSKQVFQTALKGVLKSLNADRAFIYSRSPGNKGKIVAESVAGKSPSLLQGKTVNIDYLEQHFVGDSSISSQNVRAISNIYLANLSTTQIKQLEAWDVCSELVAPFVTDRHGQNILVVHQCRQERSWQQSEIDFFAQLTSQLMLAWERTNLLQQQKAAREELQHQALNLLTEVEPIGMGDLTTRATVTEGEIGTLADSYNSTVESLQKIVIQVQRSTTQMTTATSSNEEFAHLLSERASQQSEAAALALDRIQAMTDSVQEVAHNTKEVEATFQDVLQTVANGDIAIDRAVTGILNIRETVAETAKKVKRLGESSQKISKVVNLIDGFASQTNLLALNASLEASRTGEADHNFGIVAEEIRTLAQQSAEATTEIEKIVASIQLDTKEVFKAMEEGIERVAIGTQLVNETRQSLDHIANSSQQVNSRIAQIAQETVEESIVSQEIGRTIAEVAAMANKTSTDAARVFTSTKELLTVAEELQISVKQFKA